MRFKPKNWRKEVWLTVFIVLLAFYFFTISKMPNNLTGLSFIDGKGICEWDSLVDEFQVKDVLTLELDKYFFSKTPLSFHAYSNTGEIYLENNLLVFFPKEKYSTITVLARSGETSCSRTLKVININ